MACDDCFVLMGSKLASAEWSIAYQLHMIKHRLDRTNELLEKLAEPKRDG